jgi:hypothetical protein
MNREDIIRMAREAEQPNVTCWLAYEVDFLERFAHLVYESVFRDANIAASRTILDAAVLEEREACAKVCETEGKRVDASWVSCAAAIRARSNP